MTKVVHLTSVHRRYDQRILWRECVSLCEHDYNVTLVVNDDQLSETLECGVHILSTGFVPQGRWQRMTEGVRRVCELGLAQEADIYHLHDPELLRIALKLKACGKKVIFDSHEFYGQQIKAREWIPLLVRNLVADAYFSYETHVCKHIDGVVVPFRYKGKDMFAERSIRFAYVGNYPRKSEYEGVVIPDYQMRHGICYCGSLSRDNGISVLVEASKRAGIPVLLAGVFSPAEYKREIMSSGNHSFVQFLGYISNRQDIFETYSKCAIGANLAQNIGQNNQFDGLPSKVYEYMATSTPVLLSYSPFRKELIEKYRFGFTVDSSDVDDVTSKIQWFLEHPKEAEEMGQNGKRLLEEQFTWERAAEPELLRLYQAVEVE